MTGTNMAAVGTTEVSESRFAEETNALIVPRLRVAIWVTLFFLAVFAIADALISRHLLLPLLGLKAAQVTLILCLLAALQTQRGRKWAIPLTLATLVPFSANLAIGSKLVDEYVILLIEFCGMGVLTAVLIPWGALNQAIAVGILGVTIVASGLMAAGEGPYAIGYPEIGSLTFLGSSVYLAHWTFRQRHALFLAQQRLERAQQRFQQAVEAAPNAMLMTDSNGRILLANPELDQMFGYQRNEILGRTVEMFVPRELRAAHRESRAEFASTDSTRPMGSGRDLVGVRKDGQLIPVEIGLKSFRSDEGEFVLASIIDITQRRRAEEALAEKTRALARANDELSESNTVKEYFAATMAHELRNIFMIQLGYLELLRDWAEKAGALETDVAELLVPLERRTREGQETITSALEVSRSELTSNPHSIREVSLCKLFEDLARDAASYLSGPQVRITWHIVDGLDVIRSDPGKLRMLLRNLVINAVKFTERGTVELRGAVVEGGVELAVADTGMGIAPDELRTLFEPFRQAHGETSRLAGGVGLGLYLVKRITEMLGGTIHVDSQLNVGTTFRVRLPHIGS